MSRDDLVISDDARDRQNAAANPRQWVWVTANAGSGKTHVLAQRVIRLLLEDVEPSRILCLTYTKAAAANMRERVFKGLSEFATASDESLHTVLAGLGTAPTGAQDIRKARHLFARALETPGGLKIQTIHAFCEMVLRRFPLEANIAGHFELLQGQAENVLIAEARARLIMKASDEAAHPELAAAFATVFAGAGESGLEKLVAAALNARVELAGFIARAMGESRNWQPLYQSLGFGPDETEAGIAAALWPAGGMDDAALRQMLDGAVQAAAANFNRLVSPHANFALATTNIIEKADSLALAFLTGEGGVYSEKYISKAALEKHLPGFYARYLNAATHIQAVANRLADYRLARSSTAALLLSEALIAEYDGLKQQRGLLDFADLIARTRRLLTRPEVSAWVRYKLDAGIDHILLDEAQDTSPGQWDVLKALTEEIFDNREGSNRHRTVFVVGDPKQSIYSFQGARPESFEEQRRDYGRRGDASGQELKSVEFRASFRSAPSILKGVDAVFAQDGLHEGVTADGRGTVHESLRPKALGRIDVWELVRAIKAEPPADWTARQDIEQAPLVRVAKQVAKTIFRWVKDGFAKPGDILVLVRKRNAFIHALARELKTLNVPVGGVDRLSLLSHIAIQDLLALARICVAPADSLSLASLLKSPAFSFTDDEVMALALSANGRPLLHVLERETGAKAVAAFAQLQIWRKRADAMPVDRFFALALGEGGLRRKFVARFGSEVEDILDEFLSLAYEKARDDNPGLDAFIEALVAAPPEIKRQMDQTRNEVRILTVHGAKGLEAPHVFLVDGGGEIAPASQRPVLGIYSKAGAPLYGRDCYLWTMGHEKNNDKTNRKNNAKSPLLQDIFDRYEHLAEDEYRRLLYVAMTRAENTLTICGWRSANQTKPGWAEWVKAGLFGTEGQSHYVSPEGVEICRFMPDGAMPEKGASDNSGSQFPPQPFIFAALPPEPEIPRPLAPSAAALIIEADSEGDLDGPVSNGLLAPQSFISPVLGHGEQTPAAMLRGTLIHTLLQRLPDMPVEGRAAAAARLAARNASLLSTAEQAKIVEEAMRIVDEPAFAVLFAKGSRAEVQVSGTVNLRGKNQMIAGKIDRISPSGGIVTLIDFKTGRAPHSPSGIPAGHIVQLALYRTLVAPVFPGQSVRAALVYTSAPALFDLDEAAMAAALHELGIKPV
jgi:ATP-dependent helicase/nuclease subunit A